MFCPIDKDKLINVLYIKQGLIMLIVLYIKQGLIMLINKG